MVKEICLLVLISSITLFCFTDKTKFSKKVLYDVMEYLMIFSIIGVFGAELTAVIIEIAKIVVSATKRCRNPNQVQDIRKTKRTEDSKTLEKKISIVGRESGLENPDLPENEKLVARERMGQGSHQQQYKTQFSGGQNPNTVFQSEDANPKGNIDITIQQPTSKVTNQPSSRQPFL